LAEEGVEGTTVKAVMQLAGVGAGSFYARFKSRDELLDHLQNRFWRDLNDGWEALATAPAWSAAEPAAVVGEVVRLLVRGHSRHEALLRATIVHALQHPAEQAMVQVLETDGRVLDRLVGLFLPHIDDERLIRLAFHQLIGGLRTLVLFPDAEPFPAEVDEEDLIVLLTRNTLGAMRLAGAPEDYRELLRNSSRLYGVWLARASPERSSSAPNKEKGRSA